MSDARARRDAIATTVADDLKNHAGLPVTSGPCDDRLMTHHREAVSAPAAPAAVGPYSHAVRAGGLLFCSGQTPLDPATNALVEGTVGDRTRRCLDNLQAVCEAGGATLADAVRCAVYVTDLGDFAAVNAAYAEYFPGDPPARTTIGVAALPLGADVEIDAIVAIDR
jgi:2-iminobutanoate/2-iminopropanoate deaminase